MKKYNFNINKEFQLYAFKQIGFVLLITFFFFGLFLYNFGIVLASFMVWAFSVMGVLFIYLDLKYMFKSQQVERELKNIKHALGEMKR